MITTTKILLLGTVFALGATATGTSFAADLPRKAPVPSSMDPPLASPWAGCYFGGTAGVANHHSSGQLDFEGLPIISVDASKTGGIYGGYLGCQWQNGNFAYGIEGDLSGLSGRISEAFTPAVLLGNTAFLSTKVDWLSTVRGRAGFVIANAMVYLTGGVAFGDVKTSLTYTGFPEASSSNIRVGWTAGAGAEYMFTPHWIGRLEFLYSDLGNHQTYYNIGGFRFASNVSQKLMIGRIGLGYRW
jgi:outer membrane immunogenic protein